MKMMQIYFDGAVVPLSNKFKFLKTKVEVGKLKKWWKETVSARETGSARTPLNVNHLGTVSAFLGTDFLSVNNKETATAFSETAF